VIADLFAKFFQTTYSTLPHSSQPYSYFVLRLLSVYVPHICEVDICGRLRANQPSEVAHAAVVGQRFSPPFMAEQDSAAIPYLTAVRDSLGTSLLAAMFHLLRRAEKEYETRNRP